MKLSPREAGRFVAQRAKQNMKHVIVIAEFVNLTPAHKRFITKQGEGTTVAVAIGRAVDAILRDDRIKGHRCSFPIKLIVQNVEGSAVE